MHFFKLCAVGALCQLAATSGPAQQLTLACKGTTTEYGTQGAFDPQPVSMGIVVNLINRTVQGFDYPFDLDPLEIGYVNDATVRFAGYQETSAKSIIVGSINRVTGDMAATWSFVDENHNLKTHMTYALQCKPAQRMF